MSVSFGHRPASSAVLDEFDFDAPGATNLDTRAADFAIAHRGVTITGTPEQIDDNTFRYSFEGEFKPGLFQLSIADGSVADSSGQTLTGWIEEFELRELTATMLSPADKSNAGRNQINANGFVEVQFADPFGVGIKIGRAHV